MRQPTDKCKLCNERIANQKNSHIIPKFLGKGIFEHANPRHGILWHKSGKKQRVQDIIKEDYLLCSECEKGFGILETYCALRLNRFNNLRYFAKFKKYKFGKFEYFEAKELDIRIFNLFIYSIVWRVSTSEFTGFKAFKLNEIEEEKLRQLLNEFSSLSQSELQEKIGDLKELPNHSHVIIRPKKLMRPPSSMLSAASYNDYFHQLHLVDYVIIYTTERSKLIESLKPVDNNRVDNLVRVGLTDELTWRNFNFSMINEAMK